MLVPWNSFMSTWTAQSGGAQGGAPQGPGMWVPIIAMLAIFWFIVIRPGRKEHQAKQAMLAALKRGDEVVTTSGILGTVADIDAQVITLEVARNVKIRVLKSTIAKRGNDDAKAAREAKGQA